MHHALISRSGLRACIDSNDSLLAEMDQRRQALRADAARLADWAISDMRVPDKNKAHFLAAIDDALSDLFFEAVRETEDDIEADKKRIGEWG